MKKSISKAATTKAIVASRTAAATTLAPRRYVTVQRAAEISGESPWTWRSRCYAGLVESSKPFGKKSRLLIPIDEIERFLAAGLRPRRA